jgi:hypothetical protein
MSAVKWMKVEGGRAARAAKRLVSRPQSAAKAPCAKRARCTRMSVGQSWMRKQGPGGFFESGQSTRHGRHEAVSPLFGVPLGILLGVGLARFVDQAPKGRGRPPALGGEPFPMARQQRDFTRHHPETGTPHTRWRRGGRHGFHGSRHWLLWRKALWPGVIDQRARGVIEHQQPASLRHRLLGQRPRDLLVVARSDKGGAQESRAGRHWRRMRWCVHRRIIPGFYFSAGSTGLSCWWRQTQQSQQRFATIHTQQEGASARLRPDCLIATSLGKTHP